MSYHNSPDPLPAPCIVDVGILIDKNDMRRLLSSLVYVRYRHNLDGRLQQEGSAYIAEVFADPQQATLVANRTIHLNVCSFDYLRLDRDAAGEPCFELVQDNRRLQLVPLSNPFDERHAIDTIAPGDLEAMVAQVLSAKHDVQFDEEDGLF